MQRIEKPRSGAEAQRIDTLHMDKQYARRSFVYSQILTEVHTRPTLSFAVESMEYGRVLSELSHILLQKSPHSSAIMRAGITYVYNNVMMAELDSEYGHV